MPPRPLPRPTRPSTTPAPLAATGRRARRGALRRTLGALLAVGSALALAAPPGHARNLTSAAELDTLRRQADQGIRPQVDQRAALVAAADAPWAWGSVSGEFVTTLDGSTKRCHPAADPTLTRYLKDGAPDAYAKVLATLTSSDPDPAWARDARAHVIDLVDTTGFRGLDGDQSPTNQCALELGISLPVWIETAQLLEHTSVWSDADREAFAGWLAREAYPRVAWASRERRNNWGAAGSAAASMIADHVAGIVPTLVELWPAQRALTPEVAREEHDAMQLARIGTTWRGDTRCDRAGIQPHGGIPDELRRGSAGCDATFLPDGDDPSHTYQTMHVELLVLHAEAQRRRGLTTLFDARVRPRRPAILQAILFVVDNPTPGGRSWPWGTRTGALVVANRYYHDPRLQQALDASGEGTSRGGRSLPYARLLAMRAPLLAPVITVQ